MTDQIDPVQAAIARAQAAGAAAQAAPADTPTSTAVATTAPQGGAVAVQGNAPKLSMETMAVGSISVDQWLKVKEHGLLLGDHKHLFDTCRVSIAMTEHRGFIPKYSIKAGNPAQYWSTTDGVNASDGGSWQAAIQKARAVDPKARQYNSVDLPLTLLQPIMAMDKVKKEEVELAKAGAVLGHTTSTTNWANWEGFYREVANAGLMGKEVEVEIGYQPRENKAGNNWGVLTFKLIGELTQEESGE